MRHVFYDFSKNVKSIYVLNTLYAEFILTTREDVEKIAEVHFYKSGMSIEETDTNFLEREKVYIAMLSKLFYE